MTTKWDANAPTESTRLLQDSVRIARENEEIAGRTLEEVMEQGEKLDQAADQVESIKDMSSAARVAVRALKGKVFSRKIQLWIVIVLLLVIDILLATRMYYHHGSLYS